MAKDLALATASAGAASSGIAPSWGHGRAGPARWRGRARTRPPEPTAFLAPPERVALLVPSGRAAFLAPPRESDQSHLRSKNVDIKHKSDLHGYFNADFDWDRFDPDSYRAHNYLNV